MLSDSLLNCYTQIQSYAKFSILQYHSVTFCRLILSSVDHLDYFSFNIKVTSVAHLVTASKAMHTSSVPFSHHHIIKTTPSTYQSSLLLHLMAICLTAGCLVGHSAELHVSKRCLLSCSCYHLSSVLKARIFLIKSTGFLH